MAMNSFSKEERVAFEDLLAGFQDALVMSRNVSIYNTDQTMMERTNNVIWRPMPYIAVSYAGTDQTFNFKDQTQLTVPATIGYQRSVPWIMSATELRDALQEQRLGDSAKQKLASDINVAVLTVAGQQGTLVVRRTTAANGFDDVAQAEAACWPSRRATTTAWRATSPTVAPPPRRARDRSATRSPTARCVVRSWAAWRLSRRTSWTTRSARPQRLGVPV